MTTNCKKCGEIAELPKTIWVKHEITINEDDESCITSSVYCDKCVEEKK